MSKRGRGRGGAVKPTDRSSSSSSAASSRSSSLTRPAISTTTEDTDRLMKQIQSKIGAVAAAGLGGSARPTLRIAPNIPTSKKEKDKTDSSMNLPSTSSNHDLSSANRQDTINGNRSQQTRGGRNNFRDNNNRANYVQTKSIFGDGAQIPVSHSTPSSSGRLPSIKREGSESHIKGPNLKKLGPTKTIVIGDVDGLKYEIDEEYEPRQIPIADRKSVFDTKKERDAAQKLKESKADKFEHIDSFVQLFSQQKLDSLPTSTVKDEPIEQTDLPKSEEPINNPSQLILMQFPDVLPCTRTSSSSTKPELTSLSDLPDGFLGKLQIFKSGKCRLKLNDETYLDVDIGQPTSFLQNVMVTEMASTTNSTTEHGTATNDMNKLVCLGDIKHKLIVSLDVDHVLQDTRQ